jgi:hypothetical protein
MRTRPIAALVAGLLLLPAGASAHAPSVSGAQPTSPEAAVVLDDPTLSRAIGATIAEPGEIDWYRMDLAAGDPLVVGMTAPDATGALAATFVLLGPGLPPAIEAGEAAAVLAALAGADGALAFQPDPDPDVENHAGLGFIQYGTLALEAPADGTYWVAVSAVDPDATGKYVLAPGVREEFDAAAIAGMAELVLFFAAPWPPLELPDLVPPSPEPSAGS